MPKVAAGLQLAGATASLLIAGWSLMNGLIFALMRTTTASFENVEPEWGLVTAETIGAVAIFAIYGYAGLGMLRGPADRLPSRAGIVMALAGALAVLLIGLLAVVPDVVVDRYGGMPIGVAILGALVATGTLVATARRRPESQG
jgi:hypothetical protein